MRMGNFDLKNDGILAKPEGQNWRSPNTLQKEMGDRLNSNSFCHRKPKNLILTLLIVTVEK